MMLTKGLYRGYSTNQFNHKKMFELNDIELVKEDIRTHIFTKRRERVMMPTFGTRIPEMIFEPLDEDTIEIIDDDLRMVFEYDPRVRIIDLQVVPDFDRNAINVVANLYYVELDLTNRLVLNIQFES